MRPSRTTKGKDIDRSTEWTEYVWHDGGGYWYATRKGPTGELEYDYQYPPTRTPQDDFETPRTLETDDSLATVKSDDAEDESFVSSSTDSQQLPPGSLSDESPHYQHGRAGDAQADALYHSTTPRPHGRRTQSSTSTSNYLEPKHDSGNVVSSSSPSYTALAPTRSGDASTLTQGFHSLAIGGVSAHDYSLSANPLQHHLQIPKHIYRETDSEDFEELDHRYRAVESNAQKRFWKEGRVFMMLWTEPARSSLVDRDGGTRNGSHFSTTIWGESAYSEIRRFVVVSAGYGNNICVPIQTYSKQATLKHNLPDPQAHAIIYTGTKVPDEKWYYAEDGSVVAENLTKDPIRVVSEQKDKEGELHPASRINYSKIYTVENFVRVLNIGMVHKNSMTSLLSNSMVNRVEPPQPPRKNPPRASGGSESRDQGGRSKGSSHRDKGKDSGRRKK